MRALCSLLALVSLVVASPSAPQPRAEEDLDWWKTAVLYQIYPRSFRDSDGDGVGDLNGVTEKLEHLKDIGVTGVWLSPIFKSPMADFGYDISDFRSIDPLFGSMEDFEKLLSKAKSLGIKLILDFVPNHTSDEHEWFEKSVQNEDKYADYYVWNNGSYNGTHNVPPNQWQSVFGGPAWEWREERQAFYLHQFDPKQPDLNYENPDVVEEMKDVLRFWLEKGVDGFRVDAIPYLFEGPIDNSTDNEAAAPTHLNQTYDMVVQWRQIMDNSSQADNQTKLLMLEAYGTLDQTMKFYGTTSAPGGHFPFNFRLITDVHYNPPPPSSAEDISKTINEYMESMINDRTPNWVLGNHDQHRVASRYDPKLVDGLNFISQLLPGVSVTYNGEEIGMENTYVTWEQCVDPQGINAGPEGYLQATRDLERTPFQWDNTTNAGFSDSNTTWLPINENYVYLNLQAQKDAEQSHYKVYKRLTELRKEAAIQRGETQVAALSDRVLGFTRLLLDEDSYLVLVNFGNDTETVNVQTNFTWVPDKITVHIPSINSEHMENHTMSASDLQIGQLEAYVFKFNVSSSALFFSSSLMVFIVQFLTRYL